MKFGEFIKAKKSSEAAAQTTAPRVTSTRPQEGIKSRVVILRRRKDGVIEEKNAAPAFLRQDPRSAVPRVVLPPDYFWRGSPEHLARREELENGGA